jgi:hypothetical protein
MRSKNKLLVVAILCMTMLWGTMALALTPSDTTTTAQRNAIAKNWAYIERGYADYNCLAWALGVTNIWVWPWTGNPSLAQVNTYMSNLGYTASDGSISCDIYAYGTTSAVVHFARGRGAGPLAIPIDAKWGSCELFSHTTTNPYYTVAEGGVYGSRVKSYS